MKFQNKPRANLQIVNVITGAEEIIDNEVIEQSDY